MNVLVEFRVLVCLIVGVRSIERVRITQKHNHPPLVSDTCMHLELDTFLNFT